MEFITKGITKIFTSPSKSDVVDVAGEQIVLATQGDTLKFVNGLKCAVDVTNIFLKSTPPPFCVVGVLLEVLSGQIALHAKTVPAWKSALDATVQFKFECTNEVDGYESILQGFMKTTITDDEDRQKAMQANLTKVCDDLQETLVQVLQKCSDATQNKGGAKSFFMAEQSIEQALKVTETLSEMKMNLKDVMEKYHVLSTLNLKQTVDSMAAEGDAVRDVHISSSIKCTFLKIIWMANNLSTSAKVPIFLEVLKNAFEKADGGGGEEEWFDFEDAIFERFEGHDEITCGDLNELSKEFHLDRKVDVLTFVRDVGGNKPVVAAADNKKLASLLPKFVAFQAPWVEAGSSKGTVNAEAFYEECEQIIMGLSLSPETQKTIPKELDNFRSLILSKSTQKSKRPARISLLQLNSITAHVDAGIDIVSAIQLLSAEWVRKNEPPPPIPSSPTVRSPPTPDRVPGSPAAPITPTKHPAWQATGTYSPAGKEYYRCAICSKQLASNNKGGITTPMDKHMQLDHGA